MNIWTKHDQPIYLTPIADTQMHLNIFNKYQSEHALFLSDKKAQSSFDRLLIWCIASYVHHNNYITNALVKKNEINGISRPIASNTSNLPRTMGKKV